MSVAAVHTFARCPACGADPGPPERERAFACPRCGYTLFFNAGASVSAIALRDDGRAPFLRRAREPARGRLTLPGGFVDPGEDAEAAIRREVREETGLEIDHLRYVAALPNLYPYRGIVYPTLDLVFAARVCGGAERAQADEVAGIEWHAPAAVDLAEIAFASLAEALRRHVQARQGS